MARLPILRGVRRFCLDCQGGSTRAVRACADEACPLREWRLPPEKPVGEGRSAAGQGSLLPLASPQSAPQHNAGDAPCAEEAQTSPADMDTPAVVGEMSPRAHAALRAVRRQCMLCAGSRQDVRACRAREECPLWSYRFGVRPETYKAVRQRFFAPRPLMLFA